MRLHKLRRRQSHPLIERYIGEVITLEDFEKAHRRVAGILDVMAHGKGNETDIAGAEVEGARLTRSAEHAHACLALDVILPLVGVGVPMQLPHSAGVNFDQGRGDRANREVAGIGDPHRPALGLDRLLRHQPVAEALRYGGDAGNFVRAERSWDGGWEDVALARVRGMPEKRSRYAKILGKHLVRYVLEPVGDQERVFFVKVAIVKDQKEFAAVWIETLDRVWNPRREKPEIADADIVDEVAPLRVDGGNAGGAVKHVRPLGGLVPMHLAHAT